jgi:hypothetical protein
MPSMLGRRNLVLGTVAFPKFVTWNVMSLITGYFWTVIDVIEKCGIMIAAIQEVRFSNEGSLQSRKFTFCIGKCMLSLCTKLAGNTIALEK